MAEVVPPVPQNVVTQSVYQSAVTDIALLKSWLEVERLKVDALISEIESCYKTGHVLAALAAGLVLGIIAGLIL
jgi:hypothetical protein